MLGRGSCAGEGWPSAEIRYTAHVSYCGKKCAQAQQSERTREHPQSAPLLPARAKRASRVTQGLMMKTEGPSGSIPALT